MRHFSLFILLLINLPSYSQHMLSFPKESSKSLSNTPLAVCLRESSELIEHLENKDISQAQQLSLYGKQLLHLGQHEYAKEVFEKTLELNNKAYGKQDIRYVKALLDLANAYMLLIRYNEAAGMYEEALNTVQKTLGMHSDEYLETLNESGFVYTRVQDWSKGVSMYKEGLKVIQRQQKKQTVYHAIILNNLGVCIKNTYNYNSAIDYYEKALVLLKNSPELAISVAANLAEVYALVGRQEEARNILAMYSPLAKKIMTSKNLSFARIWMQYGVAYTALKDFDAAKAAFTDAFVVNSLSFKSITSIPDQAEDLMFKNDFLATCGQAGIMMYTIEMYKQLYESTGDINALKDGYKVVKAMTKYGEKLMGSYLSEANKLILFRLGAAILFDRSIYYAYELYQHTQDENYIKDAFFYAERSKSTLLVNALRSKESQALLNLPATILQQEKAYKAQLKELQKSQIEAVSFKERNQIQQDINDLNIQIEQFKESLQKDYPNYYEHRYSINLSELEDVQHFLAKEDKVLIEYALGLEFHYAFVVTQNSLEMLPISLDATEFKTQTLNLRKALTDYHFITKNTSQADSLFRQASRYFYTTFLDPLLDRTQKGQHLIIVPDQSLGHLPFETFLTEEPKKFLKYADYPYLIKNYPISYSYSATILLGQERRQQNRSIPKRGVLAFAAEYPKVSPNSFSHQRGGNIGVLREGLQPLPGAKEEVKLMEQYLFGEFHNGLTASEENFKKHASDYGIIHLAMHGVLDNKNPILSSLVFSEDSSAVEDNFLRAYEIAQLDLNADLVVLSACETGYGKFQQGEGVMSLAHSFSYAGASSILMSLWQVNDFSTSKIMKNFYTNIAKGWTKEKALRQAKLDYLEQTPQSIGSHPAFWAAFVQTGDVEALELVAKTGKTFKQMELIFLTGLSILLLAVGYGLFRKFRRQ